MKAVEEKRKRDLSATEAEEKRIRYLAAVTAEEKRKRDLAAAKVEEKRKRDLAIEVAEGNIKRDLVTRKDAYEKKKRDRAAQLIITPGTKDRDPARCRIDQRRDEESIGQWG